jgi:hypothetical protein
MPALADMSVSATLTTVEFSAAIVGIAVPRVIAMMAATMGAVLVMARSLVIS